MLIHAEVFYLKFCIIYYPLFSYCDIAHRVDFNFHNMAGNQRPLIKGASQIILREMNALLSFVLYGYIMKMIYF